MSAKTTFRRNLKPLSIYLTPEVYKRLAEMAKLDERAISATAAFMIQHALDCGIYIRGHVPASKIKYLRGQKES